MKLCLGTVQFGLDYGLHNDKVRPVDTALGVLRRAWELGVRTYDTAYAYGTAEEVLGRFLREIPRDSYRVISKVQLSGTAASGFQSQIKAQLEESLTRLGCGYLDAYLFHNAGFLKNSDACNALMSLRSTGLTRKAGASVYRPQEADLALSLGMDFLQVPASIFDQRFKRCDFFKRASEAGMETHIRSVFLQGLLLEKPDNIPVWLNELKPYVLKFRECCESRGLSCLEGAMMYGRTTGADALVFGVLDVPQLEECEQAFSAPMSTTDENWLCEIAKKFAKISEELVMPNLWKRE